MHYDAPLSGMMRKYRRIIVTVICVAILLPLYLTTSIIHETKGWNSLMSSLWRIHVTPTEFPINEVLTCKPEDNVYLLVGVYSGIDQSMERQFIRQKWGSYAKTINRIKLLFFIGLPLNNIDAYDIRRESQMYRDIIQYNSTDTYRNLTLKSFAYFRWSQQFCKSAKYLLKIDCDMQIDLKLLLVVLEKGNLIDTFQCARMLYNMRPVRTLGHKWYIPKETYTKNVWPPYCYGPAYIISNRIASKIANLSIPKDPFPVDDVFMTGILREKLKEKIRQDILSFNPGSHYVKTDTKVIKGNITTYIKPVLVKKIQSVSVKNKSP